MSVETGSTPPVGTPVEIAPKPSQVKGIVAEGGLPGGPAVPVLIFSPKGLKGKRLWVDRSRIIIPPK